MWRCTGEMHSSSRTDTSTDDIPRKGGASGAATSSRATLLDGIYTTTEMRGLHQCLARAAAPYTLVRPLRSARAKSGVLAGTRATPTRWLARERCRIHAHSCLDWTLMKPKPSFGLVMYHMVCHVPVPSDSLCPWLQRPRVAFVSPAHTRSRLHFYTIQAPDSTLVNLKVGNRRISIIGARAKERVNTEHLPRASKYFPAYPFFQ